MEEKTEWREQSENQIGREEKWQTCWCCRDQQRAFRMAQASAEKLEQTGPAEKKEWPQCHRESSSWQIRQSRLCQKRKEQSRLSRAPDRKESIQYQRSKEEQQQSKEKETSIPLQKNSESGSKKQSHPNELSENSRKRDVRWGERPKKEGRLVELVSD